MNQYNRENLNDKHLPLVSFVIPMYNEAEHIQLCLDAILSQDYPTESIEIHIVDSASNDDSLAIVEDYIAKSNAQIFKHHNPKQKTSLSLNIGIKAAQGKVVIILGAHTEIGPNFISLNVQNLELDNVWCSGGTQINVGKTVQQSSIGVAMSHWFGFPSAAYRYRKTAGFVNTVVYGAYKKEVFEEVGLFEEEGVMSEDAELNWRIVNAGYKIYFDPRIHTRYSPRKTVVAFFKQLYNYGILRSQVFRKHGSGLLWLHFIPPLGFIFISVLAILSFIFPLLIFLLATLLITYMVFATYFAIEACFRQKKGNPIFVFIAFINMHFAWALGFLAGMIRTNNKSF